MTVHKTNSNITKIDKYIYKKKKKITEQHLFDGAQIRREHY